MLKAIGKKKTKYYKTLINSSHKEEGDQRVRVTSEDEITSIVFGPLDYFPVADVWFAFSKIFTPFFANSQAPLPSVDVADIEIKFWDRLDQVEPDLVVIVKYMQGGISQEMTLIHITIC